MVFGSLRRKWLQYRYRFVPWIVLNLKERTVRSVIKDDTDKVITDNEVHQYLHRFLSRLEQTNCHHLRMRQDGSHKTTEIDLSDNRDKEINKMLSNSKDFRSDGLYRRNMNESNSEKLYRSNLLKMKKEVGFVIERRPSKLPAGGTGVFVIDGRVPPRTVVSLYPGVIYQPYDPILFQSIANPFIFRCVDNILIDGNDKKLSRYIYRSCSQRDRHGPYFTCDTSWLTSYPINPLAVGQYVNNQSKHFPANVAYQEFNIPEDFPFPLLKYIPNVHYSPSIHYGDETNKNRLLRVIVLVSTKEINQGEELFSTYFTVIQ